MLILRSPVLVVMKQCCLSRLEARPDEWVCWEVCIVRHAHTRALARTYTHTSSRLSHLIFLFFPWLFWLDGLGLQFICWCGQRWRWKKKHPLSCAWQPLPPNKYMLSRLPCTKGVCCQIRRLKFSTSAKSMFCFVRKYRTDILPCDRIVPT